MERRREWMAEWESELWHLPRRGATRFCLGAFRDAFWLRQNDPFPAHRPWIRLESPVGCLAFLATVAAASVWIALHIPPPRTFTAAARLTAKELPLGCIAMLMLSSLVLPALRLGLPDNRRPAPRPGRARRGIFLALKIALVQPILLGGFFILMWPQIRTPLATQLGLFALWILPLRWTLIDQGRRCPVCLRLLTDPVRIGSASQTFLEWHGNESLCPRGHGLLESSEVTASYARTPRWLDLDDSCKATYSETAETRP
jgi:hypothetical protein